MNKLNMMSWKSGEKLIKKRKYKKNPSKKINIKLNGNIRENLFIFKKV